MGSHVPRLTSVSVGQIQAVQKYIQKTFWPVELQPIPPRTKIVIREQDSWQVLKQKCDYLRREMKDRDRYISKQDSLIAKCDKFIDQCTMKLPKVGRVPSVRCADCRKPHPLTDYNLRVPRNTTAEHWLVLPYCKSCRRKRQTRADQEARRIAKQVDEGEHVTEMAGMMVSRLKGYLERSAEQSRVTVFSQSSRGRRVYRGSCPEDDEDGDGDWGDD